jgi:hypothetical protein
MPQPMLCVDAEVCHGAERCRSMFSKPHSQDVVTVLLGLLECECMQTLSGMSRFLAEAPWVQEVVVVILLEHVRTEMQPQVEDECEQQLIHQPTRRGRPKQPSVTGYLRGDDATMSMPKGRNMEGLGTHHSTTYDQRVVGHSLVRGLSVLLDRTCPLAPQMSRQALGCEAEEVTFQSTIELMEKLIRTGEPVAGTTTHVVLESWSCATCVWHAACERDVLITAGLTSTRWLRGADETMPHGWRWQKCSDDLASVTEQDVERLCWPRGGTVVPVPVVTTIVRTLFRCQIVIVRHAVDAPLSHARDGASSDLEAETKTLLTHISASWDREGLFGDGKEERGLDHWGGSTRDPASPPSPLVCGCMSRSYPAFILRWWLICLPPDAARLRSAKIESTAWCIRWTNIPSHISVLKRECNE